jgi:hypothetical protein
MEFQHGGWAHWHLLILGVSYIDHAALTDLWGYGYVWVRRADEAELRYVCKYLAKDGEFPAFLYLRPIRSVKIIRVSPGFWNPSTSSMDDDADGAAAEDGEDATGDDEYEDEPVKLPIYVTIGEMIERGEEAIVCRQDCEVGHRYLQVRGDPWNLFGKLRRMGGKVVGSEKGWLQRRGIDLNDVRRVHACEGGRKAAALHLIDSGNPPEIDPDDEVREADDNPPHEEGWVFPLRKWMKLVIEWQLGWREVSV